MELEPLPRGVYKRKPPDLFVRSRGLENYYYVLSRNVISSTHPVGKAVIP